MVDIMKNTNSKVYVSLFLLFISRALYAADYSYGVSSEYEDSDNISGLQAGAEGEVKTVGINFTFGSTNYREWEIELNGGISNIYYSTDELGDETLKELEANVLYKPLQSHFTMYTLVNSGVAPINRFQPQEVNNIRDELVIALRPLYSIPLTKIDTINIGYAYVDYQLEDVDTTVPFQISSNTATNFILNYEKEVNASNSISFNFGKGKTDFKDNIGFGAIDYEQDDLFLRWVVEGQTNQLQVEYGKSKIVDEFLQKLDISLQTFSFDRQINTENSLELSYSKSFGNVLDTNQATNTVTTSPPNDLNTAQIVEDHSFSYTHNGNVFNTTFGFSNTNLNQVFTENIEKRKSIQLELTYRLSRILNNSGLSNISFLYTKSESDFDTSRTDFVYHEVESYNVAYNYVYSSNFTISLIYASRDTSQLDINLLNIPIESESFSIRFAYGDRGRL